MEMEAKHESAVPVMPYKFLPLPLTVQIGGGVSENSQIRLTGRTFENASSFKVRLACGEANKDDVPLAIASDIPRKKVTLSTYDSSAVFGRNTATVIQTDYFRPAAEFDFAILCSADKFTVRFGNNQYEYPHKLAFFTVRYLIVEGDLNLQNAPITGVPQGEESKRIPVSLDLPDNITTGRKILVCGIPVRAHPHRMAIDFGNDNGNLSLHFNPRFYHQVVVRNNYIDNVWQTEDRTVTTPFPFVYGVPFELTFIVHQGRFEIKLNGYPLCNFVRDTPGKLKTMHIFGSAVISRVEFVE